MERKITLFFIALCVITLYSCKKQQTIYDALIGDWGLVEVNHNGIINTYSIDELDWAIYSCKAGCTANVLYTEPNPGFYTSNFYVSSDQKWLIGTGVSGASFDSFEIMDLTGSKLVTRHRSTGVVEIDTWLKK